METSPLAPFAGGGVEAELAKVAEAMLSKTRFESNTNVSPPKLTFTNLRCHTLSLRWKPAEPAVRDECTVDGQPVRYDLFPLLKPNGAHNPNGSPLTLQSGGQSRVYAFKQWTVTEGGGPSSKPVQK